MRRQFFERIRIFGKFACDFASVFIRKFVDIQVDRFTAFFYFQNVGSGRNVSDSRFEQVEIRKDDFLSFFLEQRFDVFEFGFGGVKLFVNRTVKLFFYSADIVRRNFFRHVFDEREPVVIFRRRNILFQLGYVAFEYGNQVFNRHSRSCRRDFIFHRNDSFTIIRLIVISHLIEPHSPARSFRIEKIVGDGKICVRRCFVCGNGRNVIGKLRFVLFCVRIGQSHSYNFGRIAHYAYHKVYFIEIIGQYFREFDDGNSVCVAVCRHRYYVGRRLLKRNFKRPIGRHHGISRIVGIPWNIGRRGRNRTYRGIVRYVGNDQPVRVDIIGIVIINLQPESAVFRIKIVALARA